jgi:hypothetical protein
MARRERGPRPRLRRVISESARLYVSNFGALLLLGLVVFVPVGLFEAVGISRSDVEGYSGASVGVVVAITFVFAYLALLGEVLYSGMVTRAVVDERRGQRHAVHEVLRSLPVGRLILADVLLVVIVALGLLALVIPGAILLTWFILVAPVIEVERRGVIAAFRRSRALIGGLFWRALPLVLVIAVGTELLAEWIQVGLSAALGDSFGAEWAGSTISGLVTAPLFALPIVVLYLELSEPPRERSEVTGKAARSGSERLRSAPAGDGSGASGGPHASAP